MNNEFYDELNDIHNYIAKANIDMDIYSRISGKLIKAKDKALNSYTKSQIREALGKSFLYDNPEDENEQACNEYWESEIQQILDEL